MNLFEIFSLSQFTFEFLLFLLQIFHDNAHHLMGSLGIGGLILKIVNLLPLLGNGFWGQGIDVELHTGGPLPPLAGDEASTDLIECSVVLAGLMNQVRDKWSHVIGLECLDDFGRHDGLCHTGAGQGSNAVASDVALLTLFGKCLGEAPEAEFSGGIVGLAEGAIDA